MENQAVAPRVASRPTTTLSNAAILAAGVLLIRLGTLSWSSFGWYHGYNEAIYSKIAVAYASHPWVPTLGNRPFFDTPPLLTYLMAASFRVFGHTEFAARLPSLLALPVFLWAVGRIASDRFGHDAGHRAVFLAASMPWVVLWFGRAQTDALLTAFVTLTYAGLQRVGTRSGWWMGIVGFALANFAKQDAILLWAAVPFLTNRERAAKALFLGTIPSGMWWWLQIWHNPQAVLASLSFHVHARAVPFANWPYVIAFGAFLGVGVAWLCIAGGRRWALWAPALAFLGFALADSPVGHEYYTLPAVGFLAVLGSQWRPRSNWVALIVIANLGLSYAVLAHVGDLGDHRVEALADAIPIDGRPVYAPARVAPAIEWYSGHNVTIIDAPQAHVLPGAYVVAFEVLPCRQVSMAVHGGDAWFLYAC